MTRNLVILLTSVALGGVSAAAPAVPPDGDDDATQADPVDPYQPAQPAPGPQVQPQPQQPQQPTPRAQRARLGISVGSGRGAAMVNDVIPGSAAERAGLQVGDQIVSVAGSPTTTADQVVQTIAARRPGDLVAISVFRNGQRIELRATLEAERSDIQRPPRWNRFQPAPGFRDHRPGPGMRGSPFGGELELRRQLDEANRRIDELERRLEQLERGQH